MIGIQGNFNKIPMPIPQSIPQPSEQEEMIEEQNIENVEGQDYITEILNISKVKEGFYIGDKIAAISIEVVVQFKLTHMINASGNQIINQWETIGMKYLTLNWSESPNQLLFDPNDEIADKILFFIDDSFINGEGILAHSFKGQNRVCIVVLIYLMKKYKWSLKKSMEYLKSKKQDVDIPPYFLSQLIKFESRLIQKGELTKDIPWSFENLKNPEEKLLRNTYINGLNRFNKNDGYINYNKSNCRHILWADSNPYQQKPISVIDLDRDLFFKKNIKPIFSHQQNKVLKPCIKMRNINEQNDEKDLMQNNINNNYINNLIKKNIINNNNNNFNNNFIISSNKSSKKSLKNNEELIEENNKQINNNEMNNNKKAYINKKKIKNENINNNNIYNEDDENININIPYTNNNNDANKKGIIKHYIPNKKVIINNNIANKNDIINNNMIVNNNNNVLKMLNDNQLKKKMKRNISENQQYEGQFNQNNFFINSYNLSNNNNYNENIQPNLRLKNNFNNNDDVEENQINNLNKFVPNEIINYNIYDEKDNNIDNNISKITKKRVEYSNPQRNNIKEENIIIITNKCDNIIKNNINNYYINQIGTINNNVNNNANDDFKNNYNYQNNNPNKQNNNQNSNQNNDNENFNNKENNNNNIKKSKKIKKKSDENIEDIENNNNNFNNKKDSTKNSVKKNNKNKNINNENIKKQTDFEEISPDINIKELNTKPFNNSKILRNNVKNILGNNHKQILGINSNNDNYYFIGQNYNTTNNIDSNITPKSMKNPGKLITNLSNNSNGKKFKIIDNTNTNTNTNSNNYNNNNSSNKKKNHHHKVNNHNKENNIKQNHNYNVIINTRKGFEMQTNPNQFLGRTSPRNINNNNNYKYDPIISNYNPIKKNNKNNNRAIGSNSKSKNYENNENYENNYNINNINVNNYNTSSNKPLNNFNPNLIKRKGTPTAGHQTIKINNINNNPVKIKSNIYYNNKKPSTPDMIINKSSTMVNNNSYIGPKINNTNNIFNYNISKNGHFSNNSIHKSKKLKNYNNMQRPATAPHKDKLSKEKKRGQIIHHIHENKKGINNYNKNIHKVNQRPASAGPGQGKHNHKDKEKVQNIYKYSDNNINIFNIGKKIEIELGSKYKNSFSRKRLASPQLSSNNKISLGNNNKINPAKYRLPSPMIKSTNINGKAFMTINKSNTNYYMNKSASFNIK